MPSSCAGCGRTMPNLYAVCGSTSKNMGKKLGLIFQGSQDKRPWCTSLKIPSDFVIEDHRSACSQDFLYGDKMDGNPTLQGDIGVSIGSVDPHTVHYHSRIVVFRFLWLLRMPENGHFPYACHTLLEFAELWK